MTWLTVLGIFAIYQLVCLIIILVLDAFNKDTENITMILCTLIISGPILLIGLIIKAIIK